MRKNKVNVLLLLVLLLSPILIYGQQTAQKFVVETNYQLYLPEGYASDTTKRWPLVMFLHGAGETGNDVERIKVHGLPKLINEGRQFPFIVVSPQASTYNWESKDLFKLYEYIIKENRVDIERVYLTGLSMGGFGTWAMAIEYPELFAAIIPICGGGDISEIKRLKHMPVWCFHGDKDNIVSLSSSEEMVDALRKYNDNVNFTVYPGVGHDSWTVTYANDSIYDWMLQYTRFVNKPVVIDKKILESYYGNYIMGKEKVTLSPTENKNGIQVWFGEYEGPVIYPLDEKTFYLDPYSQNYFIFNKDGDGKVSGFVIDLRNKQLVYKKVQTEG